MEVTRRNFTILSRITEVERRFYDIKRWFYVKESLLESIYFKNVGIFLFDIGEFNIEIYPSMISIFGFLMEIRFRYKVLFEMRNLPCNIFCI